MNFKPLFCCSLFPKSHVQKEARLLCGIHTASKPTILIYHWIPIISNSQCFRGICCNHGKQCLWLSRGALLVGESLPQTPFSHDKSCGCAHPSGRFSGRRNAINVLFSFPSVVPFLFLRCQVSVPHWHAPSATAAFHPAPDDMLHTPAFSSLSARHTQLESLLPSVSFVYQVPRKPPLPPDAA